MAHPKMKAITMPFKEVKVDEEGNPVLIKRQENFRIELFTVE